MKIAGHEINNWWLIGGGGGLVLVIYLYKRGSSSSNSSTTAANSASAIDPVTGLPYSEDSQIDPLTGMTYLAEAQEYGSVSAAEAAVSSGSAYGSSYGADNGYSGTAGYPTLNATGGTTVNGTSYATNAAWSQAVTTGLVGLGYSAADVSAALGLFFAGQPLGVAPDGVSYATIVQAAEAEFGLPPQGTYQIIAAPTGSTGAGTTGGGSTTGTGSTGSSSGSGTGGSSSSGSGGSSSGSGSGSGSASGGAPSSPVTTPAPWAFPAPGGLHSYSVTKDGYYIGWNAVKGPSGQNPTSYSVDTYNSSGQLVNSHDTTGDNTSTAEYGAGGSGLPKGTYHTNVWANGGPEAPQHSTVTVTLTA
jgi:hypothetical protein